MTAPIEVRGLIHQKSYISYARSIWRRSYRFTIGDARALPYESDRFEHGRFGLALNFVPEPQLAPQR